MYVNMSVRMYLQRSEASPVNVNTSENFHVQWDNYKYEISEDN